jgi:TolA-binding protein
MNSGPIDRLADRMAGSLQAALLALLLFAVPQREVAADSPPSTVGSITRNNGLEKNRFIYIRTPTIMRVFKSPAVRAQVQTAIGNYDQAALMSSDPLIRAESLRRGADLRVELADGGDIDPSEMRKAIENYQRLLADYPDYGENDRVLYQLARAQQFDGQADVAIDTLRTLGRRYPDSPRVGDAMFRAAELLYARRRYEEAEPAYQVVLAQGSGTPYFEPAQYKYGWTLYKQSKYAEALPVFLAILDRTLPQGAPDDPAQALATLAPGKSEMSGDALRIASLSFAALGGGKAINDYSAKNGEPRFSVLLYRALGQQMLERQRYSDAAGTYAAFIERHPSHPLAPQFQNSVITAYRKGGFDEQVMRGTPYWGGRQPDPEVMKELRVSLGELAPWYQAKAQAEPATDPAAKQADFVAAAGWYRKILDIYPQDPKVAEINLLYADSLYDGGKTQEAAQQYEKTAYGYPNNPKAGEAAYAAVQAWQRLGKEVAPADRPAVLRQSVASSIKYADTFPGSEQSPAVLTRGAEDLYEIKDLAQADVLASRVLSGGSAASPGTVAASPELRGQALGVLADSKFAQGNYADAETAYTQMLAVTPAGDPSHKVVVEQLAASIYKQGDAARSAGDLRTAAKFFQRVGQVVPDASIRPNADYDAASAFITLQDWGAAEASLESFRARNPQSNLLGDADKKLALAYQKDNKPGPAAAVFGRLAQNPAESGDNRRDASWLSATLYDQAQQPQQAIEAYQSFIKAYPQPFDRGIEARQRLIVLSANDNARHTYWLHDIVAADGAAGPARTDSSKLAAAQAQLELGRIDASNARGITLDAPLAANLARRKQAVESAIATLDAAAGYGFADVTTAATYEVGTVYRDFSRALLNSARPAKLQGDALEQYQLLLEEQADPIEQKAIEAHRANLQRFGQGVWNDWIQKSAAQLAELAPAQYGKNEQPEDAYEALR